MSISPRQGARERLARWWRPRTHDSSDHGAGATEYATVLLVVAAAVVAVFATGLDQSVRDLFTTALCRIENDDDCTDDEGTSSPTDSRGVAKPGSPSPVNPNRPFTDEDVDAVADELDDIQEYLRDPGAHESHWYHPGSWFGNIDPNEIMSSLSQAELDALLWNLTASEIKDLLGDDEYRETIMANASLQTIRMLRQIAPELIEADTSDVGGDDANENDGQPDDNMRFRDYSDVPLWGEDGEPSTEDINQGGLGDCWWLAGMGAVVEHNPDAIMDIIEENDNGTYTVTFQDTGEKVTVTPDLASNGKDPAFAQPSNDALWPAILEKALAEREGTYGEIEGGGHDPMELVAGGEEHKYPASENADDLQEWYDDEIPLTISTVGSEGPLHDLGPHEGGLVAGHAYTVTKVEDGMVHLYNPWGHGHPDPIPIEDIEEQTDEIRAHR